MITRRWINASWRGDTARYRGALDPAFSSRTLNRIFGHLYNLPTATLFAVGTLRKGGVYRCQ
jgi:hypothetical protein